jgi:hypothetical protein
MTQRLPKVQHGDVIFTAARTAPLTQLGVRHYGIWDARRCRVIHNALPGVQLTTWEDFANGPVYLQSRTRPIERDLVVKRARAKLGTRYNLFAHNCEHFVTEATAGERQSPQLQRALFTLATGVLVLGAMSRE